MDFYQILRGYSGKTVYVSDEQKYRQRVAKPETLSTSLMLQVTLLILRWSTRFADRLDKVFCTSNGTQVLQKNHKMREHLATFSGASSKLEISD